MYKINTFHTFMNENSNFYEVINEPDFVKMIKY